MTFKIHDGVEIDGKSLTNSGGTLTWGGVSVGSGGGVSISSNANNRVLTGDGSNAVGETNLTFDGTNLQIVGSTRGLITEKLSLGATDTSFIERDSTVNIGYRADGVHRFWTYNGSWLERAQITDTGFNLLAGHSYHIGGTAVINSARGLTNITSGNIAGNLTIDYTGNATNDAGLRVFNDNSDWGIYIDKDGTATYGLKIAADGAYPFQIVNSSQAEKFRVDSDGDIETVRNINASGTVTASGGNSGNWNTAYGWGNHASGGYLTSSSTQSKYLRSDAADTFSGHLSSANNVSIRFVAANATDANDGKIAAGLFSTGLNIVGAQTSAGTGRQVRIWGDVITDGGHKYWNANNDGSGSGLDADLLDGQDNTFYRNASNLNAGTLNNARLPAAITVSSDIQTTAGLLRFTSNNHVLTTNNANNILFKSGGAGAMGLAGQDSGSNFRFQVYGDGTSYGFLDGTWAGWDIKKVINGAFSVDEGSGLKRVLNEANWTSYATATNISNLGINANLLDGLDSTSFARLNHDNTSEIRATNFKANAGGVYYAYTAAGNLRGYMYATDTNDEHLVLRTSGGEDIAFKDDTTNNMIVRGDGNVWIRGAIVNGTIPYSQVTSTPTIPSLSGYATESYVGTQIANLVDSSPAALNTLNELAAAIGDDASFSTTITNSIATKLPLVTGVTAMHNTQGTQNTANTVLRTQVNGYAMLGWINTTSGATSSTLTRIYCSQDGYIRYQTPANFGVSISPHINYNNIANKPTTIANSDTVDNLHAASFLRSDTGDTAGSKITFSTGLARSTHHVGHLEGSYNNIGGNSTKSNPIYTIGSSYNPSEAALSNMYGIGFAHPNFTPWGSGKTSDWGMYVATGGSIDCTIGAGTTTAWFKNNIALGGTVDGRDVAADGTKLDTIATSANNYSFPYTISASASNSTVVQRHSSGYIFANYFNTTPNTVSSGVTQVCVETGNDGYIRHGTADAIRTFINAKGVGSATGASQVLTSNTNSYFVHQNWIDIGANGIYSSSTNNAHFRPNNVTSYGSWAMSGSKNGYDGLVFDTGGDVAIMFDSSGNGGHYRQANSRWFNYHHVGNNCTGFGASTTSSSYQIYATGAIYATGDIVGSSDERLKTEIKTIPNALDKVLQLRGVTYKWKEEQDKNNITETRMGVIAQEILDIIPEVVTHDVENDRYGVSYGHITGLLIEAIKQQQEQINLLKKEIKGE